MYATSPNLFKNIFDKWSDYLINEIIIFLVKFKTNFFAFVISHPVVVVFLPDFLTTDRGLLLSILIDSTYSVKHIQIFVLTMINVPY